MRSLLLLLHFSKARMRTVVCLLTIALGLAAASEADEALLLQQRSDKLLGADAPLKCQDGGDMWGVWIDGRSVGEVSGKEAYGEAYSRNMAEALQSLLQMQAKGSPGNGTDLVGIFRSIQSLVGHTWRSYPNPVFDQVFACHEVLPPRRVSDIMANITILEGNLEQRAYLHEEAMQKLFESYSARLVAAGPQQALTTIGWLLQNIAFLHPLKDGNGRARLLLLQYELRRNNLACGTMMYNNNKDIYFEPLGEYVQKIQEGIDMYRQAQQLGSNPWRRKENHAHHFQKFPNNTALVECWTNLCPPSNEGCKGTSPSSSSS